MEHDQEDTCQYWLYPAPDDISDGVSTLAQVFSHVNTWTRDYVWTRQKFNLHLEKLPSEKWCLSGKTYYGENVMDEWFIVAILLEITKKLNLIARVVDSDGEVLLIQAADQLPAWAGEPDIASGRVFIFKGEVHLIPVCDHPGHVTPIPGVTPPGHVAASVVAAYPHLTRAGVNVQQVIREKIDKMPHDTRVNHHVVNMVLPSRVARLLAEDSEFLSQVITAVNERDPIDMRKSRNMSRVRPELLGSVSVKFSKCLYAMLASCKVVPHRNSGWDRGQVEGNLLGYKLALGVEILLSRRRVDQESDNCDNRQTKQYKDFIEKLKKNGYFKNEVEGSKLFKELENNAAEFFEESEPDVAGEKVGKAWDRISENHDSSDYYNSVIGPLVEKSDSEDWMEMTPEILDSMLEAQFGISREKQSNNIPEEVNKFLNKISDMAGVEHEQDEINFDADNLVDSMKKLLGEMNSESETPLFESDEDDSDLSDEGEDDPIMREYMSELKTELPTEDDMDKPLNVDANILSNLLQSYSEELGHGPASSLFQSMKVNPGKKNL